MNNSEKLKMLQSLGGSDLIIEKSLSVTEDLNLRFASCLPLVTERLQGLREHLSERSRGVLDQAITTVEQSMKALEGLKGLTEQIMSIERQMPKPSRRPYRKRQPRIRIATAAEPPRNDGRGDNSG